MKMVNQKNASDPMDQPLMSTGSSVPGFKADTKNSKLASRPKIGEKIVGDNGIEGRIR
jgi:hypothetical protein